MERTILVILLLAFGYAVIYFVLKRKIHKSLSAAAILGQVREEVDRILVELNQTTHRNITLIEDRLSRLSDLLADADKKIALIRREAEKQALGARLYSQLARLPPEAKGREGEPSGAPASPEGPKADRNSEVVRLAQAGLSPALIARRLGITLGEVELILCLAEHQR